MNLQLDQLELIQKALECINVKSTLWSTTWNMIQQEIEEINILTRDKRQEEADDADEDEIPPEELEEIFNSEDEI